MRIAIVTETWQPSINGVVTRLKATVRVLRSRGHHVLLVAPAGAEEEERDPGLVVRRVPSVGLPFIYGGQPWGLPLPRVRKLLDGFQPDLVHAVCPFLLGWAGVVYAKLRGVPLVCSYHTHIARYARFYHMGFAERPVWAVVRKAHQQAQVNLAASDASRVELQQQGVPDVGVWPGGVDLSLFHPRNRSDEMRARLTGGHPERRVCLYVGRLAGEKGVERLRPLADPGSGRHLALVGDGPARQAVEDEFRGASATFAGALTGAELAAAYASADIFVFPSTTDTLGLAVIEASASGLPVVAARSPAARELLRRAPAGQLFDGGDPADLVAAAERWLRHPLDRDELAAAARERVVSWERATDELLARYRQAIAMMTRAAAA